MSRWSQWLAVAGIWALQRYQRWLSPLLGPRCRFYPSCSHYACNALETHGAAAGSWLILKRLAKCHPFNPGGYDPVPVGAPQRNLGAAAGSDG